MDDKNLLRQHIIPIRPASPTREAIEIVVTQRLTNTGEVAIPTALIRGKMVFYIESFQYAIDLGMALIVAGYFMLMWSHYATGKR